MLRRAVSVRLLLAAALAAAPSARAKPAATAAKPGASAAAKPKPKPSTKPVIKPKAPRKPGQRSAKKGPPARKKQRSGKKPWRPKPSMNPMAPDSKAANFAALDEGSCLRELEQRGVPHVREPRAPGVKTPIRLTGPVGGVLFRTDYPDPERPHVPWEVLDCRLALSLHEWSLILRAHSVHEVRMFSVWRPPANWPEGKLAKRHPGGLAIDVRELKRDSGAPLVIQRDWHGKIGARVCGDRASPPKPATDAAKELRAIICATADARIFHSMLTPNHDRRHFNHFHLELTADVSWFMLE